MAGPTLIGYSSILSSQMIAVAKAFLTYPSLSWFPPGSLIPQSISFQVTDFEEVRDNVVSKQLYVDLNIGASFQSDNIAPGPKVYQMEGFLFALVPVQQDIDKIQLNAQKRILDAMALSRNTLTFKPPLISPSSNWSLSAPPINTVTSFGLLPTLFISGTVQVGIVKESIKYKPEVQNKIPFSLILQTVDKLSDFLNVGTVDATSATNPSAIAQSHGVAPASGPVSTVLAVDR